MKNRVNILYIIMCLTFVVTLPAEAKKHYTYSTRPNHFITMSVAGGYSSFIDTKSPIAINNDISLTNLPGAAAIGSIGYEMRYRRWILGLNANIDYTMSRHGISHFTQQFSDYVDNEPTISQIMINQTLNTINMGYSPLTFIYDYYDYVEAQKTMHVSAHLYSGANIGQYCYALLGVRFSLPLLSNCNAGFNLSTIKVYPNTNTPQAQYGNQSNISYKIKNPNGSGNIYQYLLSPSLEFGARLRIPSNSGRVGMRLGVFAEWGIPLNVSNKMMDLIDYSVIHSQVVAKQYLQNPSDPVNGWVDVIGVEVPSAEVLQKNLIVNSVLNTNLINRVGALSLTQLSVGIKWTILFNVTTPRHYCVICED